MSRKKKIGLGILAFFILIQFVRPSKVNEPVDPAKDIIAIGDATGEVAQILKVSCYDCHSNQPTYPSYFNISPVNWYLNNHIKGGLKKLNFSTWNDLPQNKRDHKMEEICEVLEEKRMPLKSYTLMHEGTSLSAGQKALLCAWAGGGM